MVSGHAAANREHPGVGGLARWDVQSYCGWCRNALQELMHEAAQRRPPLKLCIGPVLLAMGAPHSHKLFGKKTHFSCSHATCLEPFRARGNRCPEDVRPLMPGSIPVPVLKGPVSLSYFCAPEVGRRDIQEATRLGNGSEFGEHSSSNQH